jgi:hypothetical protein
VARLTGFATLDTLPEVGGTVGNLAQGRPPSIREGEYRDIRQISWYEKAGPRSSGR